LPAVVDDKPFVAKYLDQANHPLPVARSLGLKRDLLIAGGEVELPAEFEQTLRRFGQSRNKYKTTLEIKCPLVINLNHLGRLFADRT